MVCVLQGSVNDVDTALLLLGRRTSPQKVNLGRCGEKHSGAKLWDLSKRKEKKNKTWGAMGLIWPTLPLYWLYHKDGGLDLGLLQTSWECVRESENERCSVFVCRPGVSCFRTVWSNMWSWTIGVLKVLSFSEGQRFSHLPSRSRIVGLLLTLLHPLLAFLFLYWPMILNPTWTWRGR